MIGAIARKLFGSSNERRIKAYLPRVAEINALEKELEGLSDEALRARTDEFKRQVAEGTSLDDMQRKEAYLCDVTYGTNNELGSDYLRDNMKFRLEDMVHRPFHYAIVDEVDSILIDEARTPLIISGPAEDSSELYRRVNALIPDLGPDDFEKDEKVRSVASVIAVPVMPASFGKRRK